MLRAMKRTIFLLVLMIVLAGAVQPCTGFVPTNQLRINTEGMPPLLRAAEAGRVHEVRRLLASGANVNEQFPELGGFTALILAAMRGRVEVVKLLLKAGADPNAFGAVAHVGTWTPLLMAVRSKNKNRLVVIDTLIAGGAQLNPSPSNNDSPLDAAVVNNDIAMIRALLKRGSDVNWQDEFGNTPLVSAVTNGNRTVAVVRLLLEAGADPNKPAMWNGEDCESILKYLDEYQRMSEYHGMPDRVIKEIRQLIIQAGGKSFTRKSRGDLCKPASLIN